MARYIDADKLIAHLKDEIKGCEPKFGGRVNGKSVAYGTELGLKAAISFAEALSVADVVPKSECVECAKKARNAIVKLQGQINRLKKYDEERDIALHARLIAETREKVTREIFKEIEAEIQEALNSNYRARPHIAESEELYHIVEGKISALSGMEDFIAKLKKKYIPTDEKEGCTTCKHMLSCEPSLTGACEQYEKKER